MGKPFEIRKEIPLVAPPEAVWDAIATAPGLAGWFMPMEIDPASPTVTAHEPGRLLSVRLPEGPDGSFHAFEYRIEPAGAGGAVLHFMHGGFTSDGWGEDYETVTSFGWDMYLHTLGQYLTHFAGRPALYLEAEGPPESADAAAWPRLIAGLGLTEPVKEGTGVRFALAGFGPVEGIVDYVAPPYFLGLRAPHALIRFHGRFPSGMPVAVSQHTYLETFDGDAAQRAWEAWLAGVFA
jgi:hypothetical protein